MHFLLKNLHAPHGAIAATTGFASTVAIVRFPMPLRRFPDVLSPPRVSAIGVRVLNYSEQKTSVVGLVLIWKLEECTLVSWKGCKVNVVTGKLFFFLKRDVMVGKEGEWVKWEVCVCLCLCDARAKGVTEKV